MDATASALKPVWEYQTAKTMLLPYVQTNSALFTEDFLPRLYFRLRDEGTLKIIFPGSRISHLNDFMLVMARAIGFVVPCLRVDDKVVPVGLGWLAEIDGIDGARKGAFGFGFFKEMWGSRERVQLHVDLSFQMLAYWFQECGCDILYGTTLNPKARNYARRFGFSEPYTLPKFFCQDGKLVPASLIHLERDRFLEYYRRWRSLTAM
jgi:hypothetical protein